MLGPVKNSACGLCVNGRISNILYTKINHLAILACNLLPVPNNLLDAYDLQTS